MATLFDYRGGHWIDNGIDSFRCSRADQLPAAVDKTAPLEDQAKAAAYG